MSPWRTLQWRRPARSSRARASASMSSDMSRPSPRSMPGPNSSSMRPVPVPRSSSERTWSPDKRGADRLLDRLVGDMQLADAIPLGGVPAEIGLRGGGARGAHRGEPLAVAQQRGVGRIEAPDELARQFGRRRRARRDGRRPTSPSRKRSTRPASARSRRWREIRGCDWRRIAVSSETVSSASPSSARMRSRVASPAALSAPLSVANGRWADAAIEWATFLEADVPVGTSHRYKDIFIRLIQKDKRQVGRARR